MKMQGIAIELPDLIKKLLGNEREYGPDIAVNAAAKAEHKRHQKKIDELYPAYEAAKKEMKRQEVIMEEEMDAWGVRMRELQPELKDCTFFNIDRNSKFCRKPKDEYEDGEGEPKQPEWVQGVLEELTRPKVKRTRAKKQEG